MKRIAKLLSLISLTSFLLAACQDGPQTSQTPSSQSAEKSLTFDPKQPIRFPDHFQIKDLKEDQKAHLYQQLDAITRYDGSQDPEMATYSQIQTIDSQADYEALIQASQDQPIVFLIGFDACPYCKAFVPKINQLAKEAQLALYYYNTDTRQKDDNFDQVVDEVFKIQTVPHAFIVRDGQASESLDDESSMSEIEAFVKAASRESN